MKSGWIIGAIALFAFIVMIIWVGVAYYYKMQTLHKQAIQRHRAAVAAEKRALASEDRARLDRLKAQEYRAESFALKVSTVEAIEEFNESLRKARTT